MGYTVTEESFASLYSHWTDPRHNLSWSCIFVLPTWLQVWWQVFGSGAELYLRAVRQGDEIIGIAPMLIRDKIASIIGSPDVSDYVDFPVVPGREKGFFSVLLDDLMQKGVNRLDLNPLCPDSTAPAGLTTLGKQLKYEVIRQDAGVSVELDLPATWEEYLATLSRKQRHEVKRKLRRLSDAGNIDYRCHEVNAKEVGGFTDAFLKLFSLSRGVKANFMTTRMESFFRSLAEAMAEIGLLRYGILEVDAQSAAMIMGFDYNETMFLFNSAFDPSYSYLSVGLLSKVLCLKESIQKGKKKWDFLKGDEPYKYHLGGRNIPLFRYQIIIR